MLDPTKKRYPISKDKGETPNKIVRGAKSCLESNPIPTSDSEGSSKTCVYQDPGTPQETEPDLPLSVLVSPEKAWVSNGLPQGQGLWLQQTWEVWHCGISPLGGGHH